MGGTGGTRGWKRGSLKQAAAFTRAARCYWLEVFPLVRRERARWLERAATIPHPALREAAIFSLREKWEHSEGAAAFVVLAPRAHRPGVVRMTVAFQVIVDYLDTISEEPVDDVFANTRQLHRALEVSLMRDPPDEDCYALHLHRDDGGYLGDLASACREAVVALPSFDAIATPSLRVATLYAESQSVHHALADGGGHGDFSRAEATKAEAERLPDLRWWEVNAAGGSNLPVLALMAAGAQPGLSRFEADRIFKAYYPWAAALHILLHGLVDLPVDRASGSPNQFDYYDTQVEAAARLTMISTRARVLVNELPQGDMHAAILSGLGGFYLAPPQVWEQETAQIARAVFGSLGPMVKPARTVHRLMRTARRPSESVLA